MLIAKLGMSTQRVTGMIVAIFDLVKNMDSFCRQIVKMADAKSNMSIVQHTAEITQIKAARGHIFLVGGKIEG